MKWIKSIFSGATASLAMFIIMFIGINITGFAPFNITPSAAFLYNLGVDSMKLGLLLHFLYGSFWSVVFVYAFGADITLKKGLYLALFLWLFMMLVYSPIIGWGIFGMGYAGMMDPAHPLYLDSTLKYLFFTLVLHLLYGFIMGGMNKWLIKQEFKPKEPVPGLQ